MTLIERIVADVARRFHVTPKAVLGKSRNKSISYARHAAFYFLHQEGLSYPEIGRVFGVDHSSAVTGAKHFAYTCGEVWALDYRVLAERKKTWAKLHAS